MTNPILVTKLFIPAIRPELVIRPRLIERFDEGINRKLTLISAPAGFGKSTLVTEWIDSKGDNALSPFCVAWVSLDENDNDPVCFLTYLVEALHRMKGTKNQIGAGALAMLRSPQPPPSETVLTALINEIASLECKIFLVLDDYHLIDAQPVHDALTFLLENLPPQLHLIIATREDPLLPLSRLRVRNQIAELRATDLRFTPAEAADFLNQVMGLDLSADEISALEARTEGWIAGLQLAAISLQGQADTSQQIRSFTGSNRLVLDYLIEEVLSQQTEAIQDFLLQTAILDRLSGDLCAAVTGQESAHKILETLERANLFIIPLDSECRWYRYHHLFSDLLRQRLNQNLSDLVSTLHRNAGKWYENQGFVTDALQHIFAIGDYTWAAQIVESIGSDIIWKEGQWQRLYRWMENFPKNVVHSRPELCLISAWLIESSGSPEPFEPFLESVETYLASQKGDTNNRVLNSVGKTDARSSIMSKDAGSMLAEIATIRGVNAARSGDLTRSSEQYTLALEVVPDDNQFLRARAIAGLAEIHFFRGEIIDAQRLYAESRATSIADGYVHWASSIVLSRLADTQMRLGQLHQALNTYQQMQQVFNTQGEQNFSIAGYAYVGIGQIDYAWNNLDKSIEQLRKGIDFGKKAANSRILFLGHLALARALQAQGDAVEAINSMREAVRVWQQYNLSRWELLPSVAAYQAWLSLVQGDIESAAQWAQEKGLDPQGELVYQYEGDFIILARLLIAQGNVDKAMELLQRLLESAERGGRIAHCIEILSLQAISLNAQGKNDRAFSVLGKALAMAKPGGFVRVFIDEGPRMARLLYVALSQGVATDYVQRLLVAFPEVEPEHIVQPKMQSSDDEWIEPLSERELEILQLISDGLTNKEIASQLYLSLNTVKAHTRTIYSKLGVNSRTQASARARVLGLISFH